MSNTLSKGYTFGSTELVTNAKLHALVDNGTATIDTAVISATTANDFKIGDGSAGDKTITANNGDANLPNLRFNDSTNKWQFSNDDTTWTDMGSGGDSSVRGTFQFSNIVGGVYSVGSLASIAFPYTRDVSLVRANASIVEKILPDNFFHHQIGVNIAMGSYSSTSNASISFGYIV